MSIGVAILGSGIFAKEEHLPAVKAAKNVTLRAIYSRSLKSAQAMATEVGDVKLYSDDSPAGSSLKDLLADNSIQAVIIALPILAQPEYIRAALSAGKHVLSEKPVAENLKDAQGLIQWYHSSIDTSKVTWSVAENFRFMNVFIRAAEEARKLGRVLGFRVRMHTFNKVGDKYFETSWRKTPQHQGGFLLDGGVHFTAGLRNLLGPDTIVSLSANTTQLQKHLPPVDTVDATLKTKSGATGTFSVSFGTTFTGNEWTVACESGVVSFSDGALNVTKDGKTEAVEVAWEGAGVAPEVREWAASIIAGKQDARQSPEQALSDLELLENMLRSGEEGGEPVQCNLQLTLD